MNKNIYLFSISSHPDAIHINPLEITFFKPNINFSHYDNLIITSKQASEALKQYDKEKYINIPALCISTKSAESYSDIGAKILDIGAGYGDSLIESVKNYPKSKKWLYLRAEIIASSFVESLNKMGYNIDEAIVYKSECSKLLKELNIKANTTLIFTSPSAVKCYLNHNNIPQDSKVIVIGKTTAKALPNNIEYKISSDATIDSCMELLD